MSCGNRFFFSICLLYLLFVVSACGGSPQSSIGATPTSIPLDAIRIENVSTERVAIDTNQSVIDNCDGNQTITRQIGRERSTTVTMQLTVSGEAEAQLGIVKAKLGLEFSVQEGETISSTDSLSVPIPPQSQVIAEIQWYETWRTGTFIIEPLNYESDFRVRAGLDADIGTRVEPCPNISPTATSTPEPTETPTNTPTDTVQPTPTDTDLPTATSTVEPTLTNTDLPTATHTPSATATDTSTPTSTFTLTLSHTATNAPTSDNRDNTHNVQTATLQLTPGYICTANTISSESTTLSVVRAQPIRTAPIVRSVQPDELVYIIEITTEVGRKWYRIASPQNTTLGWVDAEYIILSDNCP